MRGGIVAGFFFATLFLSAIGEKSFGFVSTCLVVCERLFEEFVLCIVYFGIEVGLNVVSVCFECIDHTLEADVKFFGDFA